MQFEIISVTMIGKQCEPQWGGRTPVCGILLPYVYNPESRPKILRTGQKKEMVDVGNTAQIRKFVIDDEAYCRFEGLKKET